jgi:hypothetical protein
MNIPCCRGTGSRRVYGRRARPVRAWRWLIGCLGLAGAALSVAGVLDLGVEGAGGGRIVGASGGVQCASTCSVNVQDRALLSLFAVPDAGYRFQGWEGACQDTLGPLCTPVADGNLAVRAQFVLNDAPSEPAKALLLLHGANENHEAWNEFVKQRFGDRCPTVHGGVVLGDDAYDPRNDVYCYRIDFGYYDVANGFGNAGRTWGDRSTLRQLGYEVRAAVLGILDRHPALSLMLLSHDRGGQAAREFLLSNAPERRVIAGLLAIDSPSRATATGRGRHGGQKQPAGRCVGGVCGGFGKAVERLRYAQFEVVPDAGHSGSGAGSVAYGELVYQGRSVEAGSGQTVAAPEREADISRVLGLLLGEWWIDR